MREDLRFGPRVQLLDPHDRDGRAGLVAPADQLVAELARAEQHAPHRHRVEVGGRVVERLVERAGREVLDRERLCGMRR